MLNTSSPEWSKFETIDPFNGNLVSGKISHHHGDEYGALFIEKVNGIKCSQIILCTPKLAYPFDQNGRWHFPKAKHIFRYEKLDGTNIFAYQYHDAKGNKFVSYKTRLLPFVQESKFGPFLSMWKEMLAKYPIIPKLVFNEGINISFELWGARNPHLVKYSEPLETTLLFFRNRETGKLIAPSVPGFMKDLTLGGKADPHFLGFVDKDYVYNYQEAQKTLESQLKEIEDGYLGQEGEVWYLLDELGNWNLFKCKPSTIEAIHWSAGGIGKNIISATIENSFENWNEPTAENIKTLLLEEFLESEIEKVHYSIERQLQKAIEMHEFSNSVLEQYHLLELNILDNKVSVMRELSSKYPKSSMGKVYSIVWNSEVK